jgi:tetratricopeptide (TPR) repeat protein
MRDVRPPRTPAGHPCLYWLAPLALGLMSGPIFAAPSPVLARGDALYAEGRVADAREAWASGVDTDPEPPTLLCRLARVESEMAEDAQGETQRQLAMSAVARARAAVKMAPDSAASHLWLAVSLGRQALREGPRTKLALSREIKSEADRTIALNPSLGRAYHVRAIWNRSLATLSFFERGMAGAVLGGVPAGATMDNAVRDLQRATELEPDNVNHHLELGRTYMMLKDSPAARRELERAIALPPVSSARDPRYQEEARSLLARLAKKG